MIEDLHWIDAASANAIDRITQQRWPQLVVIGTYRPAELSRGQPGGELVLRLERRHAVEQVRLDRLDRTEVAALVAAIRGDQPPSAVVEAVYRRSGGVPFVVEELIRCCGPRSGAGDLLTVELPWSLEEAVQQQLAGLHAAERTVVEALAVYGRAAPFDALVHVTGVDDDVVLAALAFADHRRVSWSRSPTTRSGSPTPSSPTRSSTSCSGASGAGSTSAASRRSGPGRWSTSPPSPITPSGPAATTRCRRSPARAGPSTSPRAHVPGAAARRRRARGGARTIRNCSPSPPKPRGG